MKINKLKLGDKLKFNSSNSQIKTGAMLSYLSIGIGYLISIIYTPIMLRLLGQSEFGLYSLVVSVVAYLGVLNFGFGSAYMRYYSRYKVNSDYNNIATLNGMFLIIFTLIGVVAIIAGSILALNTSFVFGTELTVGELETAKVLMLILVVNLAISFPSIVFTSHITANERFVFQKFVQIIRTIFSPFVILPILLLGYGSIGLVVTTTVLNLIIELLYVWYCLKVLNMKFSFKHFDFSLMKEMSVFSSFIFFSMVIDQVNWNVDKFILGRLFGTVSVAIYGLAAQLNSYYLSFSVAISSVFIPRIHRMVANDNSDLELTQLFTRIGRMQFMILSPIISGFIFFGQPFITMWAGSDYKDSYLIALILMVPVTIPLIQNIGIEIQRAKNMHQFRSWVYLFIALFNLAITIPLTQRYGGIGAAVGTGISILIGNGVIMNWYNHVKIKLNMIYFWKQILSFIPALLIPILFGVISSIFFDLNHSLVFFVSGFIYTILFFCSIWFLAMNDEEKNLLRIPFMRLLKRLLF